MKHDLKHQLARRHAVFANLLKSVDEASEILAAKGHPHATAYCTLRDFWKRLPYNLTPAAKAMYYLGPEDHAIYVAPILTVETRPAGFGGFWLVRRRGDPEQFERFATALAMAGWPKAFNPGLQGGRVVVSTRSPRLAGALAGALKAYGWDKKIETDWKQSDGRPYQVIDIGPDVITPATLYAISEVLRRFSLHRGGWVLAPEQLDLVAA